MNTVCKFEDAAVVNDKNRDNGEQGGAEEESEEDRCGTHCQTSRRLELGRLNVGQLQSREETGEGDEEESSESSDEEEEEEEENKDEDSDESDKDFAGRLSAD